MAKFSRLRKILFFILMLFDSPAQSAQSVLATIVPLQSLACMLLEGITDVDVLLDHGTSAHDYALKPQDLKKIKSATIFLWIGPSYETFFKKSLSTQGLHIVEVLKIPGLKTWPSRTSCAHNAEAKHIHHAASCQDPHVWLDPENAQIILTFFHQTFVALMPQHQGVLDQNLKAALGSIDHLKAKMKKILAPFKHSALVSYHDGYQYLEKAFDLRYAGSVMPQGHGTLSPGQYQRLRLALKEDASICLCAERQFSQSAIKGLQDQRHVKTAVLDPMGKSLHDKKAYETMMLDLALALEKCWS